MKLKTNNLWLFFAQFWTKDAEYSYRPKSLCTLFWTGLTGLIAMIFTLPWMILGAILFGSTFGRVLGKSILQSIKQSLSIIPTLATGAIWLFSGFICKTIFNFGELNTMLWGWLIGLVIIGVGIGISLFIAWIIITLFKAGNNTIPIQFLKARKSKLCPIINWDEK